MSADLAVDVVPADQPQQFVFDFSAKPIPINASDVFLQVVFRGTLGQEPDAVAVATIDISRTYVLRFAKHHRLSVQRSRRSTISSHPVFIEGQQYRHRLRRRPRPQNRTIATLDTLDGSQHAHLALLMGAQPQSDSISWQRAGTERAPDLTQFDPAIFHPGGRRRGGWHLSAKLRSRAASRALYGTRHHICAIDARRGVSTDEGRAARRRRGLNPRSRCP